MITTWGKTIIGFGRDDTAIAAVEAAMVMPMIIMMLVSMVDIGNGILANQKLIAAAQITADLVTRKENPTLAERDDAVLAGKLAMSPYDLSTYAYNVISIEFDVGGTPDILWEDTSGVPTPDSLVQDTDDLGGPGEGVVMVRLLYTYKPFFTGFAVGDIDMQEVAYLRGRKSSVVGLPL
jgi:Flp pilus assembly protein TadG